MCRKWRMRMEPRVFVRIEILIVRLWQVRVLVNEKTQPRLIRIGGYVTVNGLVSWGLRKENTCLV